MQAQAIDARIMLTVLAFVLALTVAVAAPLTGRAADGPDVFSMCWTVSGIMELECIEANDGTGDERGTASVARPEIVRDTVTDYIFMEQNTWGEDFDYTPVIAPYFPSWDDFSLRHNGIVSY